MLKKCCLAFTALLTIISILIFYNNIAFSQQLAYLNSNKKLSENYSPGQLYYSEDKYNTLLANLLFKKNYTSVKNYVNPGHVNGNFLQRYTDQYGQPYDHKGIDFKADTNTEVYSPISGIVIKPANDFDKKFGCIMIYDPIHDIPY